MDLVAFVLAHDNLNVQPLVLRDKHTCRLQLVIDLVVEYEECYFVRLRLKDHE